ncbi:uncharacterized protein LOC103508886 [Diaphorina citri]|uniref:Uncharacterized protein LOC103508886 n=1 Tax=Diaphorina citri TaxID=121845 RepID=A0A3Q0ISA9_DIACI|nr:uncharacterized protein LOC103508886 [Diaphorina citri]
MHRYRFHLLFLLWSLLGVCLCQNLTEDVHNIHPVNPENQTTENRTDQIQPVTEKFPNQIRMDTVRTWTNSDQNFTDNVQTRTRHFEQPIWIDKIFSDAMWTFVPGSKVNSQCTNQGQVYRQHLRDNTHWAVRMLDASVVSPSGLLDGDLIQYGHADQCIHTHIPIQDFSTQFCMPTAFWAPKRFGGMYDEFFTQGARDWPPYDMSKTVWDFLRPRDVYIRGSRQRFTWGICVPEACSASDIQTSLDTTLAAAFEDHGIEFHVDLAPIMCYSAKEIESRKMPLGGQLWVITVLILAMLMMLGTIVDYQHRKNSQQALDQQLDPAKTTQVVSFFIAFSFISNMERLCKKSEEEEVPIFHAAKFLGMCFVICFHRYLFGLGYSQNLTYLERILHDTKFFFLNASSQLLDVFFFLAGFLLSWNIIRRRNQDKETPFLFVIFYRVLRLYPILLAAISFNLWVQPYLAEGPRWKIWADSEAQSCRTYWWHNLLFISTLFDKTDFCVTVSWFISTDFQLFLVSLFVVYLAEKFPKYRTAVLSTAFVVSHMVPSLIIYLKNEKSFWMASVSDVQDVSHAPYIREYYVKFYMRSPPYIYGLCGGYMVNDLMKRKFKATGDKIKLSRKDFTDIDLIQYGHADQCIHTHIPIQDFSTQFCMPTAFWAPKRFGGMYDEFFTQGARDWPPYDMSKTVWDFLRPRDAYIRGSRQKFTWGICVPEACSASDIQTSLDTTLAAAFEDHRVISQFLCHPLFTPLGRLTYHMYLIHFITIPLDIFTLQASPYYNVYALTLRTFGDILMSVLLSLVTTLLFESPIGILRKKYLNI